MINGVSNVSGISFKATAADKVTPDLINKPGSFEKADVADLSTKKAKKGGFLKKFAATLATAAVVAGGLVLAAKKGLTKAIPEGADGVMAKISDKLFKAGDAIANFFTSNWAKLTAKKEAVETVVTEAVEEVAEAAAKP